MSNASIETNVSNDSVWGDSNWHSSQLLHFFTHLLRRHTWLWALGISHISLSGLQRIQSRTQRWTHSESADLNLNLIHWFLKLQRNSNNKHLICRSHRDFGLKLTFITGLGNTDCNSIIKVEILLFVFHIQFIAKSNFKIVNKIYS